MPTFISAVIENTNNIYKLTITWGYLSGWWPWTWDEVFICKTLEEAKSKLLLIRTRHVLKIIDNENHERNLDMLKTDDK